MIPNIYGNFEEQQFEDYKKELHRKLFWLLLYKDPKELNKYDYVDFDGYFKNLMKEIDGFNELMDYPKQIVEMMSLLEAAFLETQKDIFEYQSYRKLVLDAHGLIDRMEV